MSKFKSFKEYLRPKKCMALIKRTLMSSSANRHDDRNRVVKHYSNEQDLKESTSSASSAEGFIPLLAKDSEFIDLSFYNPNFNNRLEDEDCEEEVLQAVDCVERQPMQLLFPGVDKELFSSHKSTSEVTKLLVGQKANFGHMKMSRNLLPPEQKLIAVQEMPQEERNQSHSESTDLSAFHPSANETLGVRLPHSRRSTSGNDASGSSDRNDSDEETNTSRRRTHLRRRKRRSDLRSVNSTEQTAAVPESPHCKNDSCLVAVQSNDSLLGTQEQTNLSPQRQREKERLKSRKQGRARRVELESRSTTGGAASDYEESVEEGG